MNWLSCLLLTKAVNVAANFNFELWPTIVVIIIVITTIIIVVAGVEVRMQN